MAVDRTGQTLNVYSGATKIASAAADKLPAHAKLDPGDYAAGAFKGTWQDADGNESDKVDFPALTIPVPKVAVTGATITPASGSVDVGKTVAFSVAVAPDNATDKSGKWSIKDATIGAIDDNGTVTGVKGGTTEVDFTTTDGAKIASAALTVNDPAASSAAASEAAASAAAASEAAASSAAAGSGAASSAAPAK